MLLLGPAVQTLLDGEGSEPDVRSLTALFFGLYLLMATQDVAVDGWALTLLSKRNVGLASTANAVGQTVGYFAAFTGFLALSEHGLATLPGFMRFWGAAFLLSAVAVWLKVRAAAVVRSQQPLTPSLSSPLPHSPPAARGGCARGRPGRWQRGRGVSSHVAPHAPARRAQPAGCAAHLPSSLRGH